jgi:hypothetical protein
VVLHGVSPASLDEAADRVVTSEALSVEAIEKARQVTAPHFSLAAGSARYDALLTEVFGG